MPNSLRGIVREIRQPKTMTTRSGQPFTKRELILDCTRHDSLTGERGFDNFPCVNFYQDRCSLLDPLLPGMVIDVAIDITGRFNPDKNEYYNDIRGYRVDILRHPQSPAYPQSSAAYPQSPAAYPQSPAAYPQSPAAYPTAPCQPATPLGASAPSSAPGPGPAPYGAPAPDPLPF